MTGYIKFLIPPPWWGILTGEGNILAVGKNIKWERGSNIIFPVILSLLGRKSSGESGKGPEIFGKKKMGTGRILSCCEVYTPLVNIIYNLKNFGG